MGLYIRWQQDPTLDDLGNRPVGGLAAGSVFWLSCDLAIENGVDAGTAKAGVQQQIVVNVRNTGPQVADAKVQIWAARFGVGGAHALHSVGPGFDRSGMVPGAAAGASGRQRYEANWTPEAGEAGHCCLMANVYAPALNDGARVTPALVGSDHVFNLDIPHDAHHAQRNIEVAPADGKLTFMVWAADEDGGEFELEVVERVGRFDRGDLAHLATNPAFTVRRGLLDRDGGLLRPVLPVLRGGVGLAGRLGADRLLNRLGGDVVLRHPEKRLPMRPATERPRHFGIRMDGKTGRRFTARLEPDERRELVLELETAKRPKPGVHRFDIVQRRQGAVTSGARILAVVGDRTLVGEALGREG